MRNLLSLAVTAFLLLCPTRANQTDYFPSGILGDTAQSSRFKEQWYSEQLRALKEPSLWELSKSQKTQTYRFLWLRSFHHPISVRLDIHEDGTGLLTTKVTDGRGGYKPGTLVTNEVRALTKEETTWALDEIKAAGFWGRPSYQKPKEGVGPNGEKTVEIGLDGGQWIFEGVKDGKYQVADRWSPRDGPIRSLGEMMLFDLAKLELLYTEVY